MRDRVWLSCDLTAGRGYSTLHRWLALMGAKECGPTLFTFFYEYQQELVPELRAQMERQLSLSEGDRLYLIYKDHGDGEVSGVFLFGERGLAPWQKTN